MATKIFIILFSLTIISIKLASANSVKEQIGLNDPQKSVTINGNTLYYKHPYTTKETCINKTPTTPDKITQHLNIAYQGQLMYHNRSCPDKAACGFSCGIVSLSKKNKLFIDYWVTPILLGNTHFFLSIFLSFKLFMANYISFERALRAYSNGTKFIKIRLK